MCIFILVIKEDIHHSKENIKKNTEGKDTLTPAHKAPAGGGRKFLKIYINMGKHKS